MPHSAPLPAGRLADAALLGVDFTAAPRAAKPTVVAHGRREGDIVHVARIEALRHPHDWPALLQRPGPWVGGFDLPFGLPRALLEAWGWVPPRPLAADGAAAWAGAMRRYGATPRAVLRDAFRAWCDARPVGAKFAHRACDGPAGSSPSMKWVNPPVAWMLHAALPAMLDAGLAFPAHGHSGAADGRIALEAYPGLVARSVLGRRSYKSDAASARADPARRAARADLVAHLQTAGWRGVRLGLGLDSRVDGAALVDDPRGDVLDAALCLLAAGWAAGAPGWGLPPAVDPIEGWIVGA